MEKVKLESAIVKQILAFCRDRGISAWKINGNGYQQKGLPDIIAIAPNGRFLGMEVKRPKPSGYGLTALQERTLRIINLHGGYGAVVRSVADASIAIMSATMGASIKPDESLEAADHD